MKATFNKTALVALVATLAFGGSAWAGSGKPDRTRYDCRVVVGYRTKHIGKGGTIPVRRPIYACPHRELMAAGKCQSHWLFGMRCTE